MRCYQPIFIVLTLFLAGCAGILPETPRERYYAVELTYTNAVEEIQRQHDLGIIDQSTLDSMKLTIQAGNEALDAAYRALVAGDFVTLDGKLALARVLVDTLRAILLKETSVAAGNPDSQRPYSYLSHPRLFAQSWAGGG